MRVVAVLCAVFAVAVAVNTCTGISAFSTYPDANTACDMVAVATSTGGTSDLATVCFRWSGSALYYHVEASVAGGVTMAHLHDGGPMTVSGPVLVNLTMTTPNLNATTFIGCIANVDTLPGASMIDMREYMSLSNYIKSGRTYFNAHSSAAPAGACRGQVVWSPQLMAAEATGMGANTSSMANAVGVASLVSGTVPFQAVNSLTYDGTGMCTMAHIHVGALGTTGAAEVIVSGSPFIATSGVSQAPLSTGILSALPMDAAGQYPNGNMAANPPNAGYWNYHTVANSANGEIRGTNMLLTPNVVPTLPRRMWNYVALLNAGNEQASNSPSNATTGFGIFLAEDFSNTTGQYLYYALMTNPDSGDFLQGHIHIGDASTNGNVLTPIMFPSSSNGWRVVTGYAFITAATTDPMFNTLRTNGLYVNLHTDANKAGAIRGQIAYAASNVHMALLTGNQQSIPTMGMNSATASPFDGIGVWMGAHAGADFTETAGNGMYYLVHNIPAASVTAQHIHGPLIGMNTTSGVWNAIATGSLYGTQVFQGMLAETAGDATNFAANIFYFNVHTAINPNGELRGNFTVGMCGSATTCFNPVAVPYGTATSTTMGMTTMGMTTAPATSSTTTSAAASVVASVASVVIAALVAVFLA